MSAGQFATAYRGADTAYLAELIKRKLPLSVVQRMSGCAMSDVQLIAEGLRVEPASRPAPASAKAPPITYAWSDPNTPPPAGTMARAFLDVATARRLNVSDLIGRNPSRHVSRARHEAMWTCAQITRADGLRKYSDGDIGRFCDGRDHSTVHSGREGHAKRLGLAAK